MGHLRERCRIEHGGRGASRGFTHYDDHDNGCLKRLFHTQDDGTGIAEYLTAFSPRGQLTEDDRTFGDGAGTELSAQTIDYTYAYSPTGERTKISIPRHQGPHGYYNQIVNCTSG